jgi:hypothetical protein
LLDGYGFDRALDTPDDGSLATWDTVKAQAAEKFGIILDDFDGNNIPMILIDLYGNFIPGPMRGLPQLVVSIDPLLFVEGNPGIVGTVNAVVASQAVRVNHSFFLNVAHSANPIAGGAVAQANLVPDANEMINIRIDTLSGVRPSKVDISSGCESRPDKVRSTTG